MGSSWRRCGLLVSAGLLIFSFVTAAWMAGDHRRVYGLLRVLTGAGAVAALYGIAQYFGVDPISKRKRLSSGRASFHHRAPARGTIGHADYFATWLLPIVFIAIGSARRETRPWAKAASYGASCLAVAAIALSGTRSATLGLLVGLGYLLGRGQSPYHYPPACCGRLRTDCVRSFCDLACGGQSSRPSVLVVSGRFRGRSDSALAGTRSA